MFFRGPADLWTGHISVTLVLHILPLTFCCLLILTRISTEKRIPISSWLNYLKILTCFVIKTFSNDCKFLQKVQFAASTGKMKSPSYSLAGTRQGKDTLEELWDHFFCCHELLGSSRLGSQDLPPGVYTEILVSSTFLFTSNLAVQPKPAGGSKSLASLNCCPFFVLEPLPAFSCIPDSSSCPDDLPRAIW